MKSREFLGSFLFLSCGQLIEQLIGLGVGAYHKNKRGTTKIPPAYLIASVQTSWKPHPVRCQNATLWKLLNSDRATLSPLCQEGQTAVRRMPRSHVRHRLVRGSDSNNCVLSRLGASLLQLFLRSTCSLLSMFAFQVIRPCTCNKAVFWLKPSRRGPQQTCTRLFFFLCGLHSLPKGTSD